MRPAPPPLLFGRPARRIHCLGVGGMGMAPLAIYAAHSGFEVSGEDDALAPEVGSVLAEGGVTVGPLPEGCDLVAHSTAIPRGHPVLAAAAARRIPIVRRGELLAELMRDRRLVAVCGSHGKTTTTAMIVTILRRAGFPAGYVLGGLFNDGTPPARAGSNGWVVAEIDESDGTIDGFSPEITVAVNLDWDHPDRYRGEADFEAAFEALFARTTGLVLASDSCAKSLRLAAGRAGRLTFGRSGDFSGVVTREEGEFLHLRLGGRLPPLEALVRARGDFNAANATAALAAAQAMGVPPAADSLAGFPGVRRRQAILRAAGGLTVIEDYAHHPGEIRALLASLRGRIPGDSGRLIAVFQPHRYSRTAAFKAEFAAALSLADRIHLLDVYPAGENPIAGGTTADIYAEMKRNAAALPVDYLPGGGAGLSRALSREARPGDLVAFVGAGDIDRIAREWTAELDAAAGRAASWDALAAELRRVLSPGSALRREEPLGPRTTIGVGGAARLYSEPAGPADLGLLLAAARSRRIGIFVLGRGSNLIIPDEGVDALVISFSKPAWAAFEPLPDGRLRVGAGLRLKQLCGSAAAAGLPGFEFLEGIPGSVGGALRMNAGAMGGWMFDVVDEVDIMREDGSLATLRRAEMHVDYRHCAELHTAIALGAVLRPKAAGEAGPGPAAISRQIDAYRRKRHESQPREPSAGCIFRNPPGGSAGRLIEECGLKGERVGDAEVSPVHANFIINRGQATGADVLELVRRVRDRVRRTSGVTLEPEVLLCGRKWEDVL